MTTPPTTPYRILSLDGGGSWALLQVRCLQRLFAEAQTGHQVLRHFDLVAANSGGSIVLAGLVADMPLTDILGLFLNEATRRAIFSPTSQVGWRLEHRLAHLTHDLVPDVGPRYDTPQKLRGLAACLPTLQTLSLDEVPAYVGTAEKLGPQVLIPAFDYTRQRATFFRSDSSSAGDSDGLAARLGLCPLPDVPRKSVRLLDAVHASSTAPVNFFDAPAEVAVGGYPSYLWDGGVAGYNNPVLAAVAEALANNISPAQVQVLSIGTGSTVRPVLHGNEYCVPAELAQTATSHEGFLRDVQKVASAIVGTPPDAASYLAFVLLNPGFAHPGFVNRNFIRANASLQPSWHKEAGHWQGSPGFTNSGEVARLLKLELDAVAEEEVALVRKIGEAWLANALPNQPIRANARLDCLVGQASFAEVARLFGEIFLNPHF